MFFSAVRIFGIISITANRISIPTAFNTLPSMNQEPSDNETDTDQEAEGE